jgi:hypothetical protein
MKVRPFERLELPQSEFHLIEVSGFLATEDTLANLRRTRVNARTIDSQIKPMHCNVATFVLRSPVFTAPSKLLIKSAHCPWGSSIAAMAATTWAATAPTREVGELRALRESVFTLALYSSGTFSHRVVTSLRRASSYICVTKISYELE